MRVDHIIEKNAAGGLDILPDEVLAAMKKIIK